MQAAHAPSMNVAATASVSSAALAVFVGLLSGRISDAPGARDQRRFWVIALSSAAYSLCNLVTTTEASADLVLPFGRVQAAMGLVQVWGWVWYSQAFVQHRPRRAERLASLALLAGAAAVLVPDLVLSGPVVDRRYPALGAVYHQVSTTMFGSLLLAATVLGTVPILIRFLRAWRAGVPHAAILAGAFATLVLLGANDALVVTRVIDTPYLLDLGFAAPVLAVAWVITDRFVESSRALDRLQGRLALEVEARTKDLASALGALNQVEKLAALGQFASGVAHEVNSPASVVTANLRYLRDACRAGALPHDGSEVVEDALQAMGRINDLVRKLVDAGRVAAAPVAPAAVRVAEAVSSAVASLRARLPPSISLSLDVPADLSVRARSEPVVQVLEHLLSNAVEAIPAGRPGRIEIRARSGDGVVRIAVVDDGVGMAPEVLRRALEPFFTTHPPGHGAGLGLSVARGLVEAHGGSLSLESTPGIGTTAAVELPEAEGPPAPTPPPDA
jgi:signal transduction histidine kinase/drug/metabolite transporter superfamily protein YnfA